MAQRWSATDPVSVTNLNNKCADGGVYQADANAPDNSVNVDASGNLELNANLAEVKLTKLTKTAANNAINFNVDADATVKALVQFFRNTSGSAADYKVIVHDGSGAYAAKITLDGKNARLGIGGDTPTQPIHHISSGAYLSTSGVWTDASSVALKENFEDVDFNAIIAAIKALAVKAYNYKNEPEVRHIGPVAEEFNEAFGVGDDQSISAKDLAGVAIAGVKALIIRLEALEEKVFGKSRSPKPLKFREDYFARAAEAKKDSKKPKLEKEV